MEKYDVTIAIPVYNASAFIEKSLRSALGQNYLNVEILILNDCSTDDSIEIILRIAKEYGIQPSIYYSPENCGVGVMRNKAIELAKGEYLFFLDSDDLMSENCLELMMAEAQIHEADLVIGSHVDDRDGVEHVNLEKPFVFEKPDEFAMYAFLKRNGYSGGVWNKLIKIGVLRDNNVGFPDFRVGEDVPFIFNLISKVHNVVILDKITYRYTIRAGSLSQENPRDIIPKTEIEAHILSKILIKDLLVNCVNKPYYIPMQIVVMDCCLDTLRVMVEKRKMLEEKVSSSILKRLKDYPAKLPEILLYGNKRDVFIYFLCHMPLPIVSCYFVLRKYYKDLKRNKRKSS